jgi:RNA polymerase sigma-70 factor (ECF subfamily)
MVFVSADPSADEARIGRALAEGDCAGAATAAIRAFGPEILGYLHAVVRDEALASDAFSAFCEDLWRGIGGFRGECSLRAWAYKLAWHAALRAMGDPFRRRARVFATGEVERLVAEVRSTTALHLRDESKAVLAEIRAALAPDEQTLLVLRIDRGLSWSEIARVLDEGGEPASEAALRKRFERLKERLRAEALARGLVPG